MLRYSLGTFRKILQPKFFYSTSTSDKLKQPSLLVKLESEFDGRPHIIKALRIKELQNVHYDEWKNHISLLNEFLFTDADCYKMISAYPHLLKIPYKDFENSLRQWFNADFCFNNFRDLLLTQPELMEVKEKEIRKRVPLLRVYFRTSVALCQLIAVSPNIMFDNWETVEEKLNYVVKIKKFNMMDLIQSEVLSKPLNFTKFRLELLEKCGIYKQDNTPIHKKNNYDKTKFKNPSLTEIIDPDDEEFIKVAKISYEEYAICEDFHNKEDEYDDDDDEGESENTGYH